MYLVILVYLATYLFTQSSYQMTSLGEFIMTKCLSVLWKFS